MHIPCIWILQHCIFNFHSTFHLGYSLLGNHICAYTYCLYNCMPNYFTILWISCILWYMIQYLMDTIPNKYRDVYGRVVVFIYLKHLTFFSGIGSNIKKIQASPWFITLYRSHCTMLKDTLDNASCNAAVLLGHWLISLMMLTKWTIYCRNKAFPSTHEDWDISSVSSCCPETSSCSPTQVFWCWWFVKQFCSEES